jgi:hypothetical protein
MIAVQRRKEREVSGAEASELDIVADAPPGLMRLVSAGVEESLQRFGDPELLAAGKANVISLEAIESHLGARWELKRDQVYDFTRRLLERSIGPGGFFTRVSTTDFFIVHPDLGRLAGQAACVRYLREVLNHFLGEDTLAAAGVLQVTNITNGQLSAQPLDARAKAQADGAPEAEDDPPEAAPAAAPEAAGPVARWSPFVASDGRQLRVTASLEPVYELKGFTRIGFRMVRRVILVRSEEELSPQQIAQLSTADLLRVDLATVERGIGRLRADSSSEQQLSLIVPLSFTSLSSQKGRPEFAKQLQEAGGLVRLGVICEITGVDDVPPGALLAATSLLRPFTLLLAGRMSSSAPQAVIRMEGSGLQAVSFDCPPGLDDAELIQWATPTVRAAKRVAKSVMIYRAGSPRQAAALASLGATHVSLKAA